jgi:RNA polymerase sigma-70 factor (ECF subfamily)
MRAGRIRAHASSVDPEAPFSVRLEAARDGNAWALAALYRTLQPKLLRYLTARDPGRADAVATQVWRELASELGSFEGTEGEFGAFGFALARRELLSARSLGTEALVDDDEALARFDAPTRDALRRFAPLPDDEADVVLLRAVGGLTVDEVAWIVGKPRALVRTLEQRGLQRLVHSLSRSEELVA